jgi:hypothetical protein
MGEKPKRLAQRLSDQETVERISMMVGQIADRAGMEPTDRQLSKSRFVQLR